MVMTTILAYEGLSILGGLFVLGDGGSMGVVGGDMMMVVIAVVILVVV